MLFKETCSIKINLALRVLNRRDDGFHDIHTLFWKLPSTESIEISVDGFCDIVSVCGADIPGENIVSKCCSFLRRHYNSDLPPGLNVRIFKRLPMGSGVGAGSGNAAALLRWFRHAVRDVAFDEGELAKLGADVAFLAGDRSLALAGGVGERLEYLNDSLGLSAVIFFPEWASDTAAAYRALDDMRLLQRGDIMPESEARAEALRVLDSLIDKKTVGFLPNDFTLCMAERDVCYNDIYETVRDSGALAWGLCGSGSACFALFDGDKNRSGMACAVSRIRAGSNYKWLKDILILE